MRKTVKLNPKALSPYAQALKQVALKGTVALGPSAKEMEIELYRKGALPADYRPPVQGKWDDTIERWAYAWQFPAEEESNDVATSVERNAHVMQGLLNFGEALLSADGPAPVAAEPKAGKSTFDSSVASPLVVSGSDDDLERDLMALSEGTRAVMPADVFSNITGVPLAYIEGDHSSACKELATILDGAGLDFTEEGITVAITALSRQHYTTAARAIFDFAGRVGLGPTAEMFKALMKHPSASGDVNTSMALVEEMKEKGITPRIGNWHELMRSFHNARDYPAITQIVDNMKMYANIEPNEITFAIQLRALAKDSSQMNALAESVQLFDQMEQVYGYIAARPHYDALMYSLSHSPAAEMRLRCEELAQKMDLMGMPWNGNTYLNLIRSAQVVGDVTAVEKYLSRMREDRIPVSMLHLSWAVQAHVQRLIRMDYETMKASKEDILGSWLSHMNTCFGVYELVVRRGWEMQLPFVNALLRLCCQTTILCMEHLPDNTDAAGKFEEQANKVWGSTFDEWGLTKDVYSYECYIALLAHQQRIDEAELHFQQMVMRDDMVPSRRTYECLIFMHLSSGEEGGAARALRYLEAMENAKIPIRASLLKKIVRVNDAAGYKRDMKRRARRIMQAREEYLARKGEGVEFAMSTAPDPETENEETPAPRPLPIPADSTLAWWEKWKKETISKHELFDEENTDGTPKGELFDEKNAALSKMGIESAFKTPDDVPSVGKHTILPKIRKAEGEMAGALWALDGEELAYPKDGGGPEGWGMRLWRERALVKKEHQRVLDGGAAPPGFTSLGTSVRVAGDQLDIEESGAFSSGALQDWRKYPHHRYDDGTAKPHGEMAHPVSVSGEMVWQGEQRDTLAPYKSDDELALESDNTFYAAMEEESAVKTKAVVQAIQSHEENELEIVGTGATRKSKHDYLEKWREMYRHGTLEAPEEPLLRFGRSPTDHKESLASGVRDWYRRNRKTPATDEEVRRWSIEEGREAESKLSRGALKNQRRPR